MGRMSFYLFDSHLTISIERGVIYWNFRAEATPFPTPRIVQGFYEMLLGKPSGDGFYKHLATRTRGPAPSADNLIPACVAFYLRNSGKIQSRKEIHRLLNRHVLRETHKVLPEEGYSSSETVQLWRDVDNPAKVLKPLFDVERTLYKEGDIH